MSSRHMSLRERPINAIIGITWIIREIGITASNFQTCTILQVTLDWRIVQIKGHIKLPTCVEFQDVILLLNLVFSVCKEKTILTMFSFYHF